MQNKNRTVYFVKAALLGVMAFVLELLEISLPIFPSFLKMDFSLIFPLLGAFALGPVAGVLIELVKNFLHFITIGIGSTAGVGDLANFLVGSALVLTAGGIYARKKTRKTAILGLICGVLAMIVTGAVVNAFITLPFYATAFFAEAGGMDAIIKMCAAIVPAIHDKFTLILFTFCPFNLLKGAVLTAVTIPVYKYVSPLLKAESFNHNHHHKPKEGKT